MLFRSEARKRWVIVQEERGGTDGGCGAAGGRQEMFGQISEKEAEYEVLWKSFCKTIAIKERENPVCQRGHLPLWYRPNMTEFC